MPISETKLSELIADKFPEAEFKLTDMLGDQNHYSLEIKSEKFNGKKIFEQHKMVKQALSDVLKSELHAITIKTRGTNG